MEKLITFVKQNGLTEDEAISRLASRLKALKTASERRENDKELKELGRQKLAETKALVEASRHGSSKLLSGSK